MGLPHSGSDTSKEAAIRALPKAGKDRRKVLDFITNQGAIGATDDELEVALGLKSSTARPRRYGLRNDGWIKDSGLRRNTRSGRAAIVWVVM